MGDGMNLAGKTAFITGGGSGIGLGLAHRFGAKGARVYIASRDTDKLATAARELSAAGIDVAFGPLDVRDPAAVDRAVEDATARVGPIDILVNNAAGNFICPAEQLSPNGWRAVVGIVLDGTFFMSRAVGRQMIERGVGGQILNIVATYVWTGGPGVVHSACAKAGVATMTQTLAVEWARHKIRVNAIAPGPIETKGAARQLWDSPAAKAAIEREVPLGRFGTVEEVANLALFLVSPLAS